MTQAHTDGRQEMKVDILAIIHRKAVAWAKDGQTLEADAASDIFQEITTEV